MSKEKDDALVDAAKVSAAGATAGVAIATVAGGVALAPFAVGGAVLGGIGYLVAKAFGSKK